MTREIIKNIPDNVEAFSHYCTIYKSAKKGLKSFRITAKALQSAITKALKIKKFAQLIITIPANKEENYILRGIVTKEKK